MAFAVTKIFYIFAITLCMKEYTDCKKVFLFFISYQMDSCIYHISKGVNAKEAVVIAGFPCRCSAVLLSC